MFSWLSLFNLQNCVLNDSIVSWLGVEKESLSTACISESRVPELEINVTLKSDL